MGLGGCGVGGAGWAVEDGLLGRFGFEKPKGVHPAPEYLALVSGHAGEGLLVVNSVGAAGEVSDHSFLSRLALRG